MNGDNRSCEDQILRAIDYGNLPQEEIERRLRNLIEVEISRTDAPADLEMIDACQSLLLEMHGQSDQLRISAEKAAETDREIPDNDRLRFHSPRMVFRIVAVTALLIMIVTISSVSLRLYWLEGHSTPDEQQYIVQSHEIDMSVINAAIAEHTEFTEIETENQEDLYTFLGFQLNIPIALQDIWTAESYNAIIAFEQIQITTFYTDAENNTLVYAINLFTDPSNARLTFEQNAEGVIWDISGNSIYVARNENRLSLVWSNDMVVYFLSGSISDEDVPLILYEIWEGE